MAALGTIRKRGAILAGIEGLGLFAFIAEEAVRSCEATQNEKRQQDLGARLSGSCGRISGSDQNDTGA